MKGDELGVNTPSPQRRWLTVAELGPTETGTHALGCVLHSMEPIDERITAAHLMALRDERDATQAIAKLLGVAAMPSHLGRRTEREIAQFVDSGDATLAAQLIHGATVRRTRAGDSAA